MKLIQPIVTRLRKLPRSRDFWFSMALFCWAGFTAFILVDGFATATNLDIFRWVIHIILFLIWGIDRYKKYKSKVNKTAST